jgi:hypothetical protein
MTAAGDAPAWAPGQPVAGWLRLTTRGVWLIREAPVEHPALRTHLNRHYFRDAEGRYCVQNGAQVVFVRLDYAPYVLHLGPAGDLVAHTGQPAGDVRAAFLDEQGTLTLLTTLGAGRVDETALDQLAERVRHADGRPADEVALTALMQGASAAPALFLHLPGGRVPLEYCPSEELPARGGFVRDPGQAYADKDRS